MKESQSVLKTWCDADFFKLGAFLSSADGDSVTFGKGGTFTLVEEFLPTESPIFYLKNFYSNNYLAYRPQETITVKKSECYFEREEKSFSPIGNDDDLYQKDFTLLKGAFSSELQKVVLISRENYEVFEEEKTILHLMERAFSFGTGIPYGFWNNSYGIIGSTPEVLYTVSGSKLKTFALAGTAKMEKAEEFLQSKKDRHEHNLVIQDIEEKLRPFVKTTKTAETKLHPYKSIDHLKTDIEGELLDDVNFTELTSILSPTAALGGYPKETSLNFLKTSHYGRKYPERYFGSAMGLMSSDTIEFIVAIRNVQWEGNHLYIECGGGVVPESQFERELEEIHLKRDTVRKHYL